MRLLQVNIKTRVNCKLNLTSMTVYSIDSCFVVKYFLDKEKVKLNFSFTKYLKWGAVWGSNPRMSEPQSDVLTTSPTTPNN